MPTTLAMVEQLVELMETAVSMLGTQYEPLYTKLCENYANSHPEDMSVACAIVRDRMNTN
jgi:hypothetical protein